MQMGCLWRAPAAAIVHIDGHSQLGFILAFTDMVEVTGGLAGGGSMLWGFALRPETQ